MSTKKKPATLALSILELEKLVNKMENEDLELEDSLACFEKGISLVSACQKILSNTEQRIKILTKKSGQDQLEAFDDDDE